MDWKWLWLAVTHIVVNPLLLLRIPLKYPARAIYFACAARYHSYMKDGWLAGVPFLPGEFMKDLPAVRRTPLKKLAEAIILQALEDLWSTRHKYESVSFFREEGFRRYARIAGMDHRDTLRVFGFLNRVSKKDLPAPDTSA